MEANGQKAMKKDDQGPQQLDIGEAEASGKAQSNEEMTKLFNFSFDIEHSPLNSSSEFLLDRPT